MRKLGAIPFCLTNVPQSYMSYACSNPVFGLTTHPLDKERTPGGSSGGEACLIAMGGSILGKIMDGRVWLVFDHPIFEEISWIMHIYDLKELGNVYSKNDSISEAPLDGVQGGL